jgi:hypothetical protein
MKLKTGQYVRHSRYGWGTVLEGDRKRTTVYFRSVGIKKLAISPGMFVLIGGQVQVHKNTAA